MSIQGAWLKLAAVSAPLASGSVEALACPFCHTATGQQIHDGIFASDFLANLFAALSPFPVLALVVALIHFGPGILSRFRRPIADPWETPHDPR